jgi:hypothetical protein
MITENMDAAGTAATPAAAPTPAAGTPAANTGAAAPAANGNPTDAAGANGAPADGSAKPAGTEGAAPEVYELKAPDGVQLESTALTEFTAIAKELKLSAADAQRLTDVAVGLQRRQAEGHAKQIQEWVAASKGDKEFGGDAFDASLSSAKKALETFGSPELTELLDGSGLGNHPSVIRFFVKLGKEISENRFVSAGSRAPTAAGQSLAKALYPSMN